ESREEEDESDVAFSVDVPRFERSGSVSSGGSSSECPSLSTSVASVGGCGCGFIMKYQQQQQQQQHQLSGGSGMKDGIKIGPTNNYEGDENADVDDDDDVWPWESTVDDDEELMMMVV
ncbi:UNVERIFIED_CONTAM: hypothetical protein HDU68_003637, partial [Siphonaria sp. JEL0065]